MNKQLIIIEPNIDSPEYKRVLVLSESDIINIGSIIPPPYGDFKEYPETIWLTFELAEKMTADLENYSEKIMNVEPGYLRKLSDAFKVSSEIIDPIEMHTITGIEWVEAMELYERIFVAAGTLGMDESEVSKLISRN